MRHRAILAVLALLSFLYVETKLLLVVVWVVELFCGVMGEATVLVLAQRIQAEIF